MKRGDLVKSSKDTSLSASVGIVVGPRKMDDEACFGKRNKWVKVLYPSELGKTFAPVDGIFLIREDHLKVVSRAEG
tara:strand:- start:1102 stop:1329 length:228 start_codon:yes stop_codon:yes gene_type:complete